MLPDDDDDNNDDDDDCDSDKKNMSVCDAANSTVLMRPLEVYTPARIIVYQVLFWISLVYYVSSTAAFIYLAPAHERLRLRSRAVAVCVFLGAFAQLMIGPFPNVVGVGNYPCWLGALSALVVVPFFGAVFLIRLSTLFYLSDFSTEAMAHRHAAAAAPPRTSSLSEAAQPESSGAESASFSSLALFASAARLLVLGRRDGDKARSLRASQWIVSRDGVLWVLCVLFFPVVVVVAVIFALSPEYVAGCMACYLTSAITACIVVEGLVVIAAGAALFHRLRGRDDAWGFRTEVRNVGVFAFLAVVFFVLSQALRDDSVTFDYGFLLVGAVWAMVGVLQVLPVIQALFTDVHRRPVAHDHDAATAAAAAAADYLVLQDVITSPATAGAFEERCRVEFTLESLWFLRDTQQFKDAFFNVSKDTRALRARRIVNLFVRPGALYEVNLPYKVIRDTVARVDAGDVEMHVFDDARKEISLLLERGTLFRFSHSAEGRRALAHGSDLSVSATP